MPPLLGLRPRASADRRLNEQNTMTSKITHRMAAYSDCIQILGKLPTAECIKAVLTQLEHLNRTNFEELLGSPLPPTEEDLDGIGMKALREIMSLPSVKGCTASGANEDQGHPCTETSAPMDTWCAGCYAAHAIVELERKYGARP